MPIDPLSRITSKYFNPDNSTCQTLHLFPREGFAFSRCQIMPGVTLQRLKGPLKKLIAHEKKMPGERGGYNFAVLVQHGRYADYVNQQLHAEGMEPLDHFYVETSSITKHVLLSLVLSARIRFRIGGEYQLTKAQGNDRRKVRLAGYSPGILQFQESSGAMYSVPEQSDTKNISRRHLVPIVNSLERYFRSGRYKNDRIGMALGSFWNSICTPFQDQAFIGLTTSLEAILSTQSMEITHTIAERAAELIGNNAEHRLQIYRQIKSHYKTRSKIVHGAAFMKMGIQNSNSLIITAKHTNIPRTKMEELANLTISIINAALLNEDYCDAIRSVRNEDKTSKLVNEFFLKRLFRG